MFSPGVGIDALIILRVFRQAFCMPGEMRVDSIEPNAFEDAPSRSCHAPRCAAAAWCAVPSACRSSSFYWFCSPVSVKRHYESPPEHIRSCLRTSALMHYRSPPVGGGRQVYATVICRCSPDTPPRLFAAASGRYIAARRAIQCASERPWQIIDCTPSMDFQPRRHHFAERGGALRQPRAHASPATPREIAPSTTAMAYTRC